MNFCARQKRRVSPGVRGDCLPPRWQFSLCGSTALHGSPVGRRGLLFAITGYVAAVREAASSERLSKSHKVSKAALRSRIMKSAKNGFSQTEFNTEAASKSSGRSGSLTVSTKHIFISQFDRRRFHSLELRRMEIAGNGHRLRFAYSYLRIASNFGPFRTNVARYVQFAVQAAACRSACWMHSRPLKPFKALIIQLRLLHCSCQSSEFIAFSDFTEPSSLLCCARDRYV